MANIELLKKVRDKITSDPDHWNQNYWGAVPVTIRDLVSSMDPKVRTPEFEISCGTTACIAGWACILSGEPMDWRTATATRRGPNILSANETIYGQDIFDRAMVLLDLDKKDAVELFHTYEHDEALARLDHLIEHENLDTFYQDEEG